MVLEQRKALELSTTKGMTLVAIWKQKIGRWYIVESENEGDLKSIIVKLTPRQFQDAIESGQYSFSW
jgi:hypothetical protein